MIRRLKDFSPSRSPQGTFGRGEAFTIGHSLIGVRKNPAVPPGFSVFAQRHGLYREMIRLSRARRAFRGRGEKNRVPRSEVVNFQAQREREGSAFRRFRPEGGFRGIPCGFAEFPVVTPFRTNEKGRNPPFSLRWERFAYAASDSPSMMPNIDSAILQESSSSIVAISRAVS